MNTYIRYLMFEAIPSPPNLNLIQFHSNLEQDPQTFEDIENQWHIPDIIYLENAYHQSQCHEVEPSSPRQTMLQLPIKRSITVEYESCKTSPTPENQDGVRFGRLKYASIGYYNRISPKTREMIYTLLNIKILESYKTHPQYWEGVDIKDYLYRTKHH